VRVVSRCRPTFSVVRKSSARRRQAPKTEITIQGRILAADQPGNSPYGGSVDTDGLYAPSKPTGNCCHKSYTRGTKARFFDRPVTNILFMTSSRY
jgi:hypothetical protein